MSGYESIDSELMENPEPGDLREEQPMKAGTIEMVNTGVPNTRAARMVTGPKRSTSTPDEVTVVWSTRPETCSCGGAGAPTVGGEDWVPRLWDTSGVGSWTVVPDGQCGHCGSILTPAWVLRDGHLDDEEIVEIALGIEGEAVAQHYDVVEIDADNAEALGYDELAAGLKVQYDGAWRYDAESLDDAAAYITGAVGVPIELVAATNYASGRRWTVRRTQ